MIIDFDRKELPTDSQIIREIQRRNEHIMDFFYYECRKYSMSTCKNFFAREDIKDDIFQQSFVKLWTEIETKKIFLDDHDNIYRKDKRGDVRVLTCNLKTFLIDIAKNDYRDWLRNDRFQLDDENETFVHMVEAQSVTMPDESSECLQEQIVADCIFDLPPRCKEILTMFYYDNMSLDEIIEARGEKNISKNGLKAGKYKCMEALKDKIKEAYIKLGLKY